MINISKEDYEDYEVLFKRGFYKISFNKVNTEGTENIEYTDVADIMGTSDAKGSVIIYLKEDTWSSDLDTLLLKEFPKHLGYISFKRIDYLLDYRDKEVKEKIKENKW